MAASFGVAPVSVNLSAMSWSTNAVIPDVPTESHVQSHVSVVRWGALSVIAIGEAVLVFVPQATDFWGWLTHQSADWWGAAGQWVGGIGACAAVITSL